MVIFQINILNCDPVGLVSKLFQSPTFPLDHVNYTTISYLWKLMWMFKIVNYTYCSTIVHRQENQLSNPMEWQSIKIQTLFFRKLSLVNKTLRKLPYKIDKWPIGSWCELDCRATPCLISSQPWMRLSSKSIIKMMTG